MTKTDAETCDVDWCDDPAVAHLADRDEDDARCNDCLMYDLWRRGR